MTVIDVVVAESDKSTDAVPSAPQPDGRGGGGGGVMFFTFLGPKLAVSLPVASLSLFKVPVVGLV